ncbi:MAG TPA: ParB/RepB/Spo0J family partition protein [Sedimentisphaerales bacterium]|nr:ParB/RepB/Spo0J family partition protein [Sedimentisphaerales bacterium]
MANAIKSIVLDKLVAHPDNPNRQSKVNFAKLLHNIERTGRYEPLVVRPCPNKPGLYQIINGHHRCQALAKLGHKAADCVVWDIDDEQTDILLATLNRLGGSDQLGKKLELLKRLKKKLDTGELARLIPHTRKQIERLTNLKLPSAPAKIDAAAFTNPVVFFLDDRQQQIVNEALSLAARSGKEKTRAAQNAAALTRIAEQFLASRPDNPGNT